MAEYTPGPWNVRELLADGTVIHKRGTYEIRTPLYDVATNVPGGGPFRNLADAELAAAAPELLAALKATGKWTNHLWNCRCCRTRMPDCSIGAPLRNRANDLRQAAIAKAKGEAH